MVGREHCSVYGFIYNWLTWSKAYNGRERARDTWKNQNILCCPCPHLPTKDHPLTCLMTYNTRWWLSDHQYYFVVIIILLRLWRYLSLVPLRALSKNHICRASTSAVLFQGWYSASYWSPTVLHHHHIQVCSKECYNYSDVAKEWKSDAAPLLRS